MRGETCFFVKNNPLAGVGINLDAFASISDTGAALSEVEEDATKKIEIDLPHFGGLLENFFQNFDF